MIHTCSLHTSTLVKKCRSYKILKISSSHSLHTKHGGATQEQLFEYVNEKFEKVCTGTTVLFIAIGSSGSGKTFTLAGKNDEICSSDGDIGLIGRTLKYKLRCIHDAEKLYVSSFEISPNGMNDLLNNKCTIDFDDFRTNAIRKNRIKKCENIHSFINTIRNNRTTAETQLNSRSSRSHLITILSIFFLKWCI